MLSNPRTPVILCVGWDKPKRSTKGQANTTPPKAHVTNHNAYACLQGWAAWLGARIKLSRAVMLRPVTCRNIESRLLCCYGT